MFYLKLSGYIPQEKQREFEQTCRLAEGQIPRTCRNFHMTTDILKTGIYYINSYWASIEALRGFTESSCFAMMVGSFKVLGELYSNAYGELTEFVIDQQERYSIPAGTARIPW